MGLTVVPETGRLRRSPGRGGRSDWNGDTYQRLKRKNKIKKSIFQPDAKCHRLCFYHFLSYPNIHQFRNPAHRKWSDSLLFIFHGRLCSVHNSVQKNSFNSSSQCTFIYDYHLSGDEEKKRVPLCPSVHLWSEASRNCLSFLEKIKPITLPSIIFFKTRPTIRMCKTPVPPWPYTWAFLSKLL